MSRLVWPAVLVFIWTAENARLPRPPDAIRLPRSSPRTHECFVSATVTQEGGILVRGKPRTLQEFGTYLSQAKRELNLMRKASGRSPPPRYPPPPPVLLRVDERTHLCQIRRVLAVVKGERIPHVCFALADGRVIPCAIGPDNVEPRSCRFGDVAPLLQEVVAPSLAADGRLRTPCRD